MGYKAMELREIMGGIAALALPLALWGFLRDKTQDRHNKYAINVTFIILILMIITAWAKILLMRRKSRRGKDGC